MDVLLSQLLGASAAGKLAGLAADFRAADDERRWIARAIRLDLPLLALRPELLLACLYRRAAWLGAPVEGTFYDSRGTPPADAEALRARVRGWAETRAREPWLRALRPPPLPLDAAVLEEYRTDVAGTPVFSRDGAALGIVNSQHAVAWERASGVRLVGAAARARLGREGAESASRARWELGGGSTWGKLVLARAAGGSPCRISLSDWQIAREAQVVSGDLVLVACDDEDDRFCYLVDAAAGQIVWRSDDRGRLATLGPKGDRLLMSAAGGFVIRSLANGEKLGGWSAPGSDSIALESGESVVAARTGPVIRVWDLERACTTPQTVQKHTYGWIDAEFAPDGTRLMTGSLLCDGVTGAPIAPLAVNGPGWLEGGPPERGRRLCRDVFAEVIPFGLKVWNTRDGELLVDDRERRAFLPDDACFDPTGRYYAIFHARGTHRLSLHRLLDGAELFSESVEVARGSRYERSFDFSADGEILFWTTDRGERWLLPTAALEKRRMSSGEVVPVASPKAAPIHDGVLYVGTAAVPVDDWCDTAVLSPDETRVATRTSHFALELAPSE